MTRGILAEVLSMGSDEKADKFKDVKYDNMLVSLIALTEHFFQKKDTLPEGELDRLLNKVIDKIDKLEEVARAEEGVSEETGSISYSVARYFYWRSIDNDISNIGNIRSIPTDTTDWVINSDRHSPITLVNRDGDVYICVNPVRQVVLYEAQIGNDDIIAMEPKIGNPESFGWTSMAVNYKNRPTFLFVKPEVVERALDKELAPTSRTAELIKARVNECASNGIVAAFNKFYPNMSGDTNQQVN